MEKSCRKCKLNYLLILLLTLPVLSGCWNAKEMEHLYYIHAMGIDYVDNQYVAYAQILNLSTMAKTEAGSGGPGQTGQSIAWVGKGAGTTVDTAVHNLYTSTQRRIFWGHLNALVLSESLMKHGIQDVLDIFTRYNETRYTMWVFGTREPMGDLLKASPIFETSPVYSQIGDPADIYKQSSFIPPVRIHRFIAQMNEPGKMPFLLNLSLSHEQWFSERKTYSTLKEGGVSVIENGKWIGWLPRSDLFGVRWMTEKTIRTPLIISANRQPAAVLICEDPKVKIIPDVRDNKARFKIRVSVKSSVIEMRQEVSDTFLREQAAKVIRNEIMDTFKAGVKKQADVFQLSHALYHKNPDMWHKLAKNGKLPLTVDSIETVDVKVKIVGSGKLMMKGKERLD